MKYCEIESFSLRLNRGETSIRKQKDNGEMFKSCFSFIFEYFTLAKPKITFYSQHKFINMEVQLKAKHLTE